MFMIAFVYFVFPFFLCVCVRVCARIIVTVRIYIYTCMSVLFYIAVLDVFDVSVWCCYVRIICTRLLFVDARVFVVSLLVASVLCVVFIFLLCACICPCSYYYVCCCCAFVFLGVDIPAIVYVFCFCVCSFCCVVCVFFVFFFVCCCGMLCVHMYVCGCVRM